MRKLAVLAAVLGVLPLQAAQIIVHGSRAERPVRAAAALGVNLAQLDAASPKVTGLADNPSNASILAALNAMPDDGLVFWTDTTGAEATACSNSDNAYALIDALCGPALENSGVSLLRMHSDGFATGLCANGTRLVVQSCS